MHTTETFFGLRGRLPLISGKELHDRVARKCIPACAFQGWRRRSFRGRSSQGLPWVCGSLGAVTSGLRVSWALSMFWLPRRVETRLLWVSDRYMCCHVARSLSSWRIRPACSTSCLVSLCVTRVCVHCHESPYCRRSVYHGTGDRTDVALPFGIQ